jgi:hypothetical protein
LLGGFSPKLLELRWRTVARRTQRMATNIAKLPELLRKSSEG